MSDKETLKDMLDALKTQQAHQALILEELMAQRQQSVVGDQSSVTQVANSLSLHKDLSERMEKFVFDAEENKTFEKWYARYESIFTINAAEMVDAEKVSLLTEKLSTGDYDEFANTILPLTNATIPFGDAVSVLKNIFGRKESLFSLRYQCLKVKKEDSENYAEYGARVNLHCEKFDIAKITPEDFKVLVFVKGLQSSQDSNALSKLLVKLDQQELAGDTALHVTLQDAINTANRLKLLNAEREMVSNGASCQTEVLAMQRSWEKSRPRRTDGDAGGSSSRTTRQGPPPAPCRLCSGHHWIVDCPFKEKQCFDCKAFGHKKGHCDYATSFVSRRGHKRQSGHRQSLEVTAARNSTRKFVEPCISGKKIRLLLDSGSDWTIISVENWRSLGSPSLTECKEQALSASGDPVKILGKFAARLKLRNREGTSACYVADSQLNVLGSDWMETLELWSVPFASVCNKVEVNSLATEVKGKFPLLFTAGLGKCNRMKASMTLKPGAKPVFRNKRPVPFAVVEPLAQELRRRQLQEVLSPVSFSQFAAPIVVVKKKNGDIRVAGDYSTGLNDALEPNQYPLPTPEEIFSKISRFRIFSKIDLSDAFLQIELDDEAKKLLTINTSCGLFQVNRLQPGVKTAPGIFQQLMDTMMAGADGVSTYMDDFIVGGVDEENHRRNLFEALQRIMDYGFRLRIEKCSFGQHEIEFLGHVVDKDGIRPDSSKLAALKLMPAPKDNQQLQAFLGAVTWYGKFIPNLKDLRGPLDELLCKDAEFVWDENRQKAFDKLKSVLGSDLALNHYDPRKKIIVAADASSYGMGAVLLHVMTDGSTRPVLYAASSFNKAEKNYPQIQREALALTFAVKKFHRYIFGRRFELQTDHKPLLSIFGSKTGIPVHTASRLQHYALTLLAYDFSIRYVDTKSFAYADFVSRLIANTNRPDEDIVIASVLRGAECVKNYRHAPHRLSDKVNVKNIENNAPGDDRFLASVKNENAPFPNVLQTYGIRSWDLEDGYVSCFAIDTASQLVVTFGDLQQEMVNDEVMRSLLELVNSGWPRKQNEVVDGAAGFFVHRNSLMNIDGCVFFGDRVVVPARFRSEVLKSLHDGHPGIVRMKLLARSKVYWPGIDGDIERLVKSCDKCACSLKSPVKCTLQSWPIPSKPWERIHIDYAGPVNGFFYLVVVDALSNWPEIFKLASSTSRKTIESLEDAFSRQGLCDVLVSDNGRQFISSEFEDWCVGYGILHLRSAPYHPQSNGQAERTVGTLKSGLEKLEGEGTADQILRKFLLCYRYTPSPALGDKSPFEIMTGRVMKTKLDLLKPSTEPMQARNDLMEQQFNGQHGAKWKEFGIGEEVYVKVFGKNSWSWKPAKIIDRSGRVNYIVEMQMAAGSRQISAHANQIKRRYTVLDDGRNALLDEFELQSLPPREVEPEISSEVMSELQDVEAEEIFEDAVNEGEDKVELPPVVMEEMPVRRTTRERAPPKRLICET